MYFRFIKLVQKPAHALRRFIPHLELYMDNGMWSVLNLGCNCHVSGEVHACSCGRPRILSGYGNVGRNILASDLLRTWTSASPRLRGSAAPALPVRKARTAAL